MYFLRVVQGCAPDMRRLYTENTSIFGRSVDKRVKAVEQRERDIPVYVRRLCLHLWNTWPSEEKERCVSHPPKGSGPARFKTWV